MNKTPEQMIAEGEALIAAGKALQAAAKRHQTTTLKNQDQSQAPDERPPMTTMKERRHKNPKRLEVWELAELPEDAKSKPKKDA